jgi:hypothetical protein
VDPLDRAEGTPPLAVLLKDENAHDDE